MIVIANKAEQRLLKDLRRLVQESPAQKCFYMGFSESSLPKQEIFKTFLDLLEEIPNSYMAQVYLCKDKDIFIMMQGFMQRHFVEFVKKLSARLNTKEFAELVDVFELGMHWEKLRFLCEEKIEKINEEEARAEEEKQRKASEEKTLNVLETMDPLLIENLAQRRKRRAEIQVMVVDDDQLSRTLVGNVLNKEFRMSFAKNGAEALGEYLSCAPDVVFLDIGLPDINGHDVLECIFQIDPDAYVIMFSGRKDKENIVRALETGASGFVGKPFTRNKLFEYIQKSPFFIKKSEKNTGNGTGIIKGSVEQGK